ncbi:MFS transporter [Roseiterribacter gracilis]|uniref:MFS transporter n=1 Tax=Roseiterribacter gracilis TaxID=2812848 RepID=A0A8S8X9F2_9PROT|nr:MFS transporter [Rhodospirillales bacterium TMPK1]
MSLAAALRAPPIRLLWLGQVLSAVGDQFYLVAVLWLALDLVGHDAGFISAVNAAAVFGVALTAGAWADRWDARRTMFWVDIARGVLVLLLPIFAWTGTLTLWTLLPVTLAVAGLTGLFDPALQATLPRLALDRRMLYGTNALFDSTTRFARIFGPGLIGAANAVVPLLQFFTIDALTFFGSAAAVAVMRKYVPSEPAAPQEAARGWAALTGGFRELRAHPLLIYSFTTGVIVNMAWALGFTMGMALLLRTTMPEALSAFGWFISAYGVGNVISNFIIAARPPKRPHEPIAFSRLLFGAGLMAMPFAPNLPVLMAIAALTATNGPLGDLALTHQLQTRFGPHKVARMVRVRFCFGYSGVFFGYLLAPALYDLLPVRTVIVGCGVACAVAGATGLIVLKRRHSGALRRAG